MRYIDTISVRASTINCSCMQTLLIDLDFVRSVSSSTLENYRDLIVAQNGMLLPNQFIKLNISH